MGRHQRSDMAPLIRRAGRVRRAGQNTYDALTRYRPIALVNGQEYVSGLNDFFKRREKRLAR